MKQLYEAGETIPDTDDLRVLSDDLKALHEKLMDGMMDLTTLFHQPNLVSQITQA